MKKKIIALFVITTSCLMMSRSVFAYVVNCIGTTTANLSDQGYTPILSLSSSTNGTFRIAGGYPYIIQCNTSSMFSFMVRASSTGCTPSTELALLNISSSTSYQNLHGEDVSVGNYGNTLCMLIDTSMYQVATTSTRNGDCNGYGTTLFSAPNTFNTSGNTHIGVPDAYSLKRCLTLITQQSLSVTLSSNSVGFGQLSPSFTRYATADGNGTSSPLNGTSSSLSLSVSTSGNIDYVVTVSGNSPANVSNPSYVISGIGDTPAALTPGVNQFGLSVVAECLSNGGCSGFGGSSSVAYPYNTSGYAYSTTAGSSTILANGVKNDYILLLKGTAYRIKMAANISSDLPSGNYTSNLTFIVTPTF